MTNFLAKADKSIAFTIFGVDIYWYGIIITSAIIIAFLLSFALAKHKKMPSSTSYLILFSILPAGILSARLFSVLLDSESSILEYFNFREGGLSILGAIIGGGLCLLIVCLVKKVNFFKHLDILVTVLILAQSIGRWGNFFNDEVYGQLVTNPKVGFPFVVLIDGQYYEALFFYESLINLVGFAIMMCIFWFTSEPGITSGCYFIYYGTVRFFLETRRQAEFILGSTKVPASRIMSLILVAVGIAILIYSIVMAVKHKNSKEVKGETEKVLHSN